MGFVYSPGQGGEGRGGAGEVIDGGGDGGGGGEGGVGCRWKEEAVEEDETLIGLA